MNKPLSTWITPVLAIHLLASAAHAQMMGGSGTPSFPGWEGHEINMNLVIPQIAVGDHYVTTLILVNMENSAQMPWASADTLTTAGRVYFYRQDGSRMQVNINGAGTVTEVAFSLGQAGTVRFDLISPVPGPDMSGWALVAVDDPTSATTVGMMDGQQMMRGRRLMASLFYTYDNGTQTVSRVGVPASLYEMHHFATSMIEAQMMGTMDTGVALVNTNAVPVTVQLSLKDATGQTMATKQLTLAPGTQMASFIDQIFGSSVPMNFQGFMEADAGGEGIVTMGLLVSQGILTSIPGQHSGQITSVMMP